MTHSSNMNPCALAVVSALLLSMSAHASAPPPSSAALAGLPSTGYASLLNYLDSFTSEREELASAEAALQAVRKAYEDASDRLHLASDKATALSELRELYTQFTIARSAHAAKRDAYRQAILDHAATLVPASDVVLLSHAMVNGDRRVPHEYRVLSLSEDEWALLRTASWKRSRSKLLTREEQAIISRAESDPNVSLARARLTQSLDALEDVYHSHLHD